MTKQLRWITVLILLFALSSLACSLTGGNEPAEEPTAVSAPVEAPTAEEPTAVPEQAEPADTEASAETTTTEESPLTFGNISTDYNFDSYHFTLSMTVTGTDDAGNEISQSIDADIITTSNPQAMSMTTNLVGMGDAVGGGENVEVATVQIEDTLYTVLPGMGCITSPADNSTENPFSDFANPDNFLSQIENADYVGKTTVNGIAVKQYHFDETHMKIDAVNDVDQLEGDVYIAQDGGYLVRLVMQGTGNVADVLDTSVNTIGEIVVELNLTEVNEPVTVEIPEACTGSGADAEYPILENATELATMSGLVSYQTETAVADVIAFYDEQMANDGWTKNNDESFQMEDTAILVYTKDDQTVNITIGADPDTGGTFVLIIADQ
ncbi:MAG: hypothetical protein Kow0080_11170 [Candidatus Promineifilaceae bacterium]